MSIVEKEILARMEDLEAKMPGGLVMDPYLSEEKQKELGITVNPLYFMQKLFLSGALTAKEQVAILSKLTDFTHQKTTQKSEVSVSRPEEFLERLAFQDEKVIDGTAEVVGSKTKARK